MSAVGIIKMCAETRWYRERYPFVLVIRMEGFFVFRIFALIATGFIVAKQASSTHYLYAKSDMRK